MGGRHISHHRVHVLLLLGNDEIESQLKRDRLMAKNEIKMLLLGAGESGKVRNIYSITVMYRPFCAVDGSEADEAHPSRRIQRL